MSKLNLLTVEELRRMKDTEGLVFPNCGGDIIEWLDGVNTMLTKEGILLNGTTFSQVSAFHNGGSTNLLFHFTEDVEINIGKLAFWRIATNPNWNAKWFSDYVNNYLDAFVDEAPQTPDDDFDIK